MSPPLEVKVWSPMACYTRPESKVERVSYPVPTPSAARGVLEAIFWKPEFSWRVREIVVLRPIRFLSILRNEVEAKAGSGAGIVATESKMRVQRHTLALSDVAYIIRADIVLHSHADADAAKYRDQFRRHVEKGRCFQRPYLGCREFAADFAPLDGTETAIPDSRDLGLMLFDLVWRQDGSKAVSFQRHGGRVGGIGEGRERREVSGTATPVFFQAALDQGVLRVPEALYSAQEALQ